MREKIEVRLEPRQVAGLAVATLLFSGGLFAAGYVVGQRSQPTPPAAVHLTTVEGSTQVVAAAVEGPGTPATALGEVEFLFPSMLGSRPARGEAKPARRARRPAAKPTPKVKPKAKPEAAKPAAPASAKAAQAAAEAVAAAKAEQARVAAKAEAEAARIAAQAAAKAEQARLAREAADKAEQERLAREALAKAEQERLAREAADTAEQERLAREAAAKAEQERLAREAAAKAERDRLAREAAAKAEQARLAALAKAEDEPSKPRYTLQVKAVKTRAEVKAFVEQLEDHGFKAQVVLANIPGKGRVYRIRVGKFATRAQARRFQKRFARESGQPDSGFIADL